MTSTGQGADGAGARPSAASALDSRYGRTPDRRPRARLVAWIAGAAVVAVVIAWVVWAGRFSPDAALEARDSGFEVVAENEIEVRWQLTAPAGSEVSCAIKAISEKKATVGWRVVEVPPSEHAVRTVSERLITTEPADGGLLYRCWLT